MLSPTVTNELISPTVPPGATLRAWLLADGFSHSVFGRVNCLRAFEIPYQDGRGGVSNLFGLRDVIFIFDDDLIWCRGLAHTRTRYCI